MNAIRTSWTICRHSLAVWNQNRCLIAFPAAMLLVNLAFTFLVALPVIFGVTVIDIWDVLADLSGSTEKINAYTEALEASSSEESVQRWSEFLSEYRFPYAGIALVYCLGIFLTAFVNVASYSEILAALGGHRVSIARGFRFAVSRLKSIAIWSVFAGTVGLLIRVVLQRIPFVRGWIAGFIGVGWSVASVFAIPVLIRDDAHNNPVEWLRSSARLIKRSWGEALSLVFGPALIVVLSAVALPILFMFVLGTIHKVAPPPFDSAAVIVLLASVIVVPFVIPCVVGIVYSIFRCSLYVYAEEGVAPGSFDASLLDRAWQVRSRNHNSGA